MAARSKLTPKVHDALIEAVTAGHFLAHAASQAGIARSTLYAWLDRGRAEQKRRDAGAAARRSERRYLALTSALEQAEVIPIDGALGVVRRAVENGDVDTAKWFLARRAGEWGGYADLVARLDQFELAMQEIEEVVDADAGGGDESYQGTRTITR